MFKPSLSRSPYVPALASIFRQQAMGARKAQLRNGARRDFVPVQSDCGGAGAWTHALCVVTSVDSALSPPSSGRNTRRRSSGIRGSGRVLDCPAASKDWAGRPIPDVLDSL